MGERPLLSAAIIVKDEAEHLRKCLASIRGVCDEIVVVDTGSSDDSVQVAREFGAVTAFRQWDDDFAAARNTALDLATGEWILYIDADEVLEDMDVEAARDELRRASNAVSIRVRFRFRPGFSPYLEHRLWRHRPDIRFVGRIHETTVPEINRVEAEEGMAVIPTEHFAITHFGYEGDQTRKNLRNLPLLERRVIEYHDRCYLWNHLATIRAQLGDPGGARDAWETCLSLIRARGIRDEPDVLVFESYSWFLFDRGEDVTELLEEGFRLCPDFHSLHLIAGQNDQRKKLYESAIDHFEVLLGMDPDQVNSVIGYSHEIFTYWPHKGVAECRYAMGDREGALASFEQALSFKPQDDAIRTKVIALRTMLGRAAQ